MTQSRLNHCLISHIYVYKEKLDKIDLHEIMTRFALQCDVSSYIPLNILSLPLFLISFIHSFMAHTYSIVISSYIRICTLLLFSLRSFVLFFQTRINCLIVYWIRRYTLTPCIRLIYCVLH